MENTNDTLHQDDDRKSRKKLLIIIWLLSVLSIVLGVLLWIEKGRVDQDLVIIQQTTTERDDFKTDLLQLQEDYSSLQTNDLALQAELDQKKEQIATLLEEAEKHKNDSYIIAKLKKEAQTLRTIMKGYIRTIDSLNTLNQNLTVEKDKYKTGLEKEQGKVSQLSKEKETLQNVVSIGSLLKANNVIAKGVRMKSGGKKQVDSKKALKTEKIRVDFVLGENRIAKSGARDIYLRIMTPDGKEMAKETNEENMFRFNGLRGFFASKERINYDNQETSVTMYAVPGEGFVPGKYIVEVYSDEAMIGQATLTLE